jgi:RNA polymerase sigma-70 factor (ECF subfamily)
MAVARQRMGVGELSLEQAYRSWAGEFVRYAAVLVSVSDAADIVADTFADLLRQPDEAWSRAGDQKGFLYGAIANHARMHHRTTQRRRDREERLALLATSPTDAPLIDGSSAAYFVDALGRLSTQQRAVLYLTYWDDRSVAQVAASLRISEGTVRRQLARARSRLREALS